MTQDQGTALLQYAMWQYSQSTDLLQLHGQQLAELHYSGLILTGLIVCAIMLGFCIVGLLRPRGL